MILNSPTISGSLTVTGNIIASGSITLSGSVASASYAANAELLDGLDSTVFTLTSSFAAQTASFTAFTASILSYTSSQNILNGKYATTGSNTFTGVQTVNSNLVVTGSITAQTLVVQTITSSVDFVTGSTRFGSLLANTHIFSGSVTMNPGGLFVSSSGLVGIGNIVPAYTLDVSGTGRFTSTLLVSGASTLSSTLQVGGTTSSTVTIGDAVGSATDSNIRLRTGSTKYAWLIASQNNVAGFEITPSTAVGGTTFSTPALTILPAGNVGIGTGSPTAKLDVNGEIRMTGSTLFRGMSSNTLQLCGGTSSSNVLIDGASEVITMSTNGGERLRITNTGAICSNTTTPFYDGAGAINTKVTATSVFMISGQNTNNSNPRGIFLDHPNTTGDYSIYYKSGGAEKFYVNGNGVIYSTSNSITLISSDVNLKTDIKDYDKGLAEVLAMKPRYFKYKDNLEEQKIGFIAQEMEQALAGSMIDVPTGLDTGEFHKSYQIDWYPLLVKAIQEMNTKLDEQNQTIQNLQEQINAK